MNEFRYYIKKTSKPTTDILILELADVRGIPVFDFKPGQYVMISYKNEKGKMQEKHAFSIASSPSRKDAIVLGIRILKKFTTELAKLKEGQEIFVSGPFGSFVFDPQVHGEAVFIAGGIGVTPFVSSLSFAADNNLSNKMSLLYSSRNCEDAIFLQQVRSMKEQNKNIRALFSITEEKLDAKENDVINERISSKIIHDFVGDVKGKTFFMCGPVPFMDAMKKNLAEIGVNESQIRMEEFSMIPDDGWFLKIRNMAYAFSFAAAIFALVFYFVQSVAKKSSTSATSSASGSNTSSSMTNTTQVQQPATVSVPQPKVKTRVS